MDSNHPKCDSSSTQVVTSDPDTSRPVVRLAVVPRNPTEVVQAKFQIQNPSQKTHQDLFLHLCFRLHQASPTDWREGRGILIRSSRVGGGGREIRVSWLCAVGQSIHSCLCLCPCLWQSLPLSKCHGSAHCVVDESFTHSLLVDFRRTGFTSNLKLQKHNFTLASKLSLSSAVLFTRRSATALAWARRAAAHSAFSSTPCFFFWLSGGSTKESETVQEVSTSSSTTPRQAAAWLPLDREADAFSLYQRSCTSEQQSFVSSLSHC